MPFISFIYKVGKNPKTYYGKCCCDYISDDHDGLDNEVKYILKESLNEYRKQKNMPKIKSKIMIGVLSLSSDPIVPTFSTNDEPGCFDFYKNFEGEIYINGKVI